MNSINNGFKYIEVDLILDNNNLICQHDGKPYNGLTFLRVLEIMHKYSNVKITLDSKWDELNSFSFMIQKIVNEINNYNVNLYKRIILQIYSFDHYNDLENITNNFQIYWLTLYRLDAVNFLDNKQDLKFYPKIQAIGASDNLISADRVSLVKSYNKDFFVYTVNDKDRWE